MTLADLFNGRSQLIVYHFMLGPGWQEGCPSCSYIADHFDGATIHLANRDIMLAAISRAPLAEIEAFQKRMGWRFHWVLFFRRRFQFRLSRLLHARRKSPRQSPLQLRRARVPERRRSRRQRLCQETRRARSFTPIRPTRADWTFSWACTTSSISFPRAATKMASTSACPGFAITTSTREGYIVDPKQTIRAAEKHRAFLLFGRITISKHRRIVS